MDEYIERKKVLVEINGEERPSGDGVYDYYSRIFDIIDTAPVADVAPVVHAFWRDIETVAFSGKYNLLGEPKFVDKKYFICSYCGQKIIYKSNYCPHCGAKMDGEDV